MEGRTAKSCQRRYQKLQQLAEAEKVVDWRRNELDRQTVQARLHSKTGMGRAWTAAEQDQLFEEVTSRGSVIYTDVIDLMF